MKELLENVWNAPAEDVTDSINDFFNNVFIIFIISLVISGLLLWWYWRRIK